MSVWVLIDSLAPLLPHGVSFVYVSRPSRLQSARNVGAMRLGFRSYTEMITSCE